MTAPPKAPLGERRLAMTYEEWLGWADDSRRSEWVGGEVVAFMPPTIRHAGLVLFLSILVSLFAERRRLGTVLTAPFEVRLSANSSREPDIAFVSAAHADRIGEKRVDGAPDLAIEIVSDDSARRDRVTKRQEYAAAGVAEYWIVDPRSGKESEEFLVLAEDGRYESLGSDADGWYRSRVVTGFRLQPWWLRADPLPDPLDCLVEIGDERI